MKGAAKVFLQHGFHGASLSQIAKAAGVNQSLIGHHFGGKQGLWDATLEDLSEHYVDRQLSELEQGQDRNIDLLTDAVSAYFRYLKGSPDAVRLNAWLFLAGHRTPPPRLLQVVKLGFERLRQGQELGFIRDDLPAEFIWAAFISFAEGWFRLRPQYEAELQAAAGDRDVDEAFLEAMASIFLNGVQNKTE